MHKMIACMAVLVTLCLVSASFVCAQEKAVSWSTISYEEAQKVLEQGGKPETVPGKATPLMNAVGNPDSRVVELLLKAEVDVNATSKSGLNAIRSAAMFAEKPNVVDLLAKAGADLESLDNLGYTPLMVAIDRNKFTKVVAAFIKAGANVNARTPEGKTPLMVVASALVQRPELVEALCAAGADINARNASGATALMEAIHLQPNLEMIKALLEQKPDVNIKDNSGHTALSKSITSEAGDVQRLLEKAGAHLPDKN